MYEEPRIMFVDIEDKIYKKFKKDYIIQTRTFGYKYHGDSECDEEIALSGNLQYLKDYQLVVVDLKFVTKSINPLTLKDFNNMRNRKIYSPKGEGESNPRLFFANDNKKSFEKILKKGGILIVFSSELIYQEYTISKYNYKSEETVTLNNYSWLPLNYNLRIENIESKRVDSNSLKIDESVINNSEIDCLCSFSNVSDENVIIKTEYGENVAFIEKVGDGYIIVFPQFKKKDLILDYLFKEYIPDLKPDLFPYYSKNIWMSEEEYILPKVKELEDEKNKKQFAYKKELSDIEKSIEREKEKYNFLTNIISFGGVSGELVKNVKKCLEHIGYEEVKDMDEELTEGNKQEDLQIRDNGRITVIEVKGHTGNVSEDDCSALLKYINRRGKETKRPDVHGILIINHQRNLPPLKRKDPAFTKAQIEDSERDDYTLVSTWELFKAIRLLEEKIISFEEIDESLHTPGLFKAIPTNWKCIGKIEKMYQNNTIACLYLEIDELKVEEEIIVQNGMDFEITTVKKIHVKGTPQEIAKKGDETSILLEGPVMKSAKIYVRR